MSQQALLYLTADSLRWYRTEGGATVLERRFAADAAGVAEFADALGKAGRRHMRYAMLVDVAEEGFNLDHVPAVRGRDRDAMLKRKLAQQFYGSPYATALSLGRETEGRRDERVLFSALTRPLQLDPWIDALIGAQVRVTGVHSVPFMLDRMMARSRIPVPNYLLVNYSPAGIRQTYFSAGRLRFSRLSGGHDQDFEEQLAASAEEIGKTLAYLSAQRLTRRGQMLPIIALARPEQFDAFCTRAAEASDAPVSIAEVGNLLDAYAAPDIRDGPPDGLAALLGALAGERQCPQIGGGDVLRFQRIHQVRSALYLASLAIILGGGLLAAAQLYETAGVRGETQSLRLLEEAERGRYETLIRNLPPPPAPLDELRTLIAEIERIEAAETPALRILRPLSLALDQFPELLLDRLAWRLREDTTARPGADAIATLRLPASLSGDQRAMLDTSEQFVAELTRQTGARVRLARRPIDIQSSQTLRGRAADDGPPAREAATFEVEYELVQAAEETGG